MTNSEQTPIAASSDEPAREFVAPVDIYVYAWTIEDARERIEANLNAAPGVHRFTITDTPEEFE